MSFTARVLGSVALALVAIPAAAQDSITIGTGSQGGAYFTFGSGFAAAVSEVTGKTASVEITGGPVQNVTLVQTGDHQMGFVTMGPAYDAFTGKSELMPGVEHTDIRALFPMYQTPLQAATLASSGITDFAQFAGKRVGIGPAGGTAATYWPRFFAATGIEVTTSNAGANDSVGQLKDGLIDAFAFAAGIPTGAFSQLAIENDAVFLSLSDEQLAKFLAAEPGMSAFTIPANTYEDQPEPLQSVSLWNFAIAHKDMDEETAYQITKLAMENHEQMMTFHAAAREMLPENVGANTFMTFHPGAVRWFEENGHTIPDALK